MIGNTPVANGSSVPRWPTRAGFTLALMRRTTSAEVIPPGLSMTIIPSIAMFDREKRSANSRSVLRGVIAQQCADADCVLNAGIEFEIELGGAAEIQCAADLAFDESSCAFEARQRGRRA